MSFANLCEKQVEFGGALGGDAWHCVGWPGVAVRVFFDDCID